MDRVPCIPTAFTCNPRIADTSKLRTTDKSLTRRYIYSRTSTKGVVLDEWLPLPACSTACSHWWVADQCPFFLRGYHAYQVLCSSVLLGVCCCLKWMTTRQLTRQVCSCRWHCYSCSYTITFLSKRARGLLWLFAYNYNNYKYGLFLSCLHADQIQSCVLLQFTI